MSIDIPIFNVSCSDRRIAYEGDWKWEFHPSPSRTYSRRSPAKARIRFLGSTIGVYGSIKMVESTNMTVGIWIDGQLLMQEGVGSTGWVQADVPGYQSPEMSFEEHTLEVGVKDAWGGASFSLGQFQIGSRINSTGNMIRAPERTGGQVPVGPLVGGIVGGAIGVATLFLLWYLLSERRRTSRDSISDLVVRDGIFHSPTDADPPVVAASTASTPLSLEKRRTTNLSTEPTASVDPFATPQDPFTSSLDDLASSDQPQQQELINAMQTLQRFLQIEPEASSSSENRRGPSENLPPYDSNSRAG
ncbi:hypothetical protein BKA70DRAFT_1398167 [Coprinopsis sp. MPI-PUGE-AT-0042]|nr:hypothetical protein BKA70DRAFT_1398167 [Coprinopsis sp. MPI-PUGE-AT-0042]